MKYLSIFSAFSVALIFRSILWASSPIAVSSDSISGSFNMNWKNLSEWFLKGSPPTYESQISATDSAISDWKIREDNGYYRIAIGQTYARMIFPDSYPWTLDDWNFNAIGIDTLLSRIDAGRRMKIIFHLLGYPKWLMAPGDTVPVNPFSGWFRGDTKLPIFDGSVDSGLVLYSELITAFCNHYDSMGIDFAMTIMAEPNLKTHWIGSWDDANRYYKAFVDGVNASTGGTDIKVGGLVWAAGGQYDGVLDSIILWANYWHNFCVDNDVRYDFICYHHYWRSPARFDTVACAFEEAFPDDEFWITEWNYKYSRFLPYDEYERYVAGMAGATGNLNFLQRAQRHLSHPMLAHFCVIGEYKDYGICHWRDSANWDYTASGHAFKWLANFGINELTVKNTSQSVSVLAASDDNHINAMLFNYDHPLDTIDFTLKISDADTYHYQIWKMNGDSFVTSPFSIANIIPPDSIEWIDTTIHIPVPYLIESDSNATGDLARTLPVDSNEIYYIKTIKNCPTGVYDVQLVPNCAQLTQIFPNPFNSSATIRYSIARPSFVELKIYNVLGQLVRTLVNENQSDSEHSAVWDGKDNSGQSLSSGIYLCRLRMGDKFSQTKKLLLLK